MITCPAAGCRATAVHHFAAPQYVTWVRCVGSCWHAWACDLLDTSSQAALLFSASCASDQITWKGSPTSLNSDNMLAVFLPASHTVWPPLCLTSLSLTVSVSDPGENSICLASCPRHASSEAVEHSASETLCQQLPLCSDSYTLRAWVLCVKVKCLIWPNCDLKQLTT
jgi:hypothetical protein